jgi:transcriptional regulator with XRE-family HTH domain
MAYAIVSGMSGRRPEESRLSEAFRLAYETAGIPQTQIAEAADVDQPTVSKWARGERPPPVWVLPIIDELCGQRTGYVLRLADLVDDGVDTEAAINSDPVLDEDSKSAMVKLYRTFVKLAASSSTV